MPPPWTPGASSLPTGRHLSGEMPLPPKFGGNGQGLTSCSSYRRLSYLAMPGYMMPAGPAGHFRMPSMYMPSHGLPPRQPPAAVDPLAAAQAAAAAAGLEFGPGVAAKDLQGRIGPSQHQQLAAGGRGSPAQQLPPLALGPSGAPRLMDSAASAHRPPAPPLQDGPGASG